MDSAIDTTEEVNTDSPAFKEVSSKGAGRFLVIDDEKPIQRVLATVLRKMGHMTLTASSAAEGLAILEEGNIDVVLSDIQMPGMTGLDLLPQIKQGHSEVEVIIMTGYATVERAVDALKNGAYDFLTKPFEDLEILERVLEKALDRKRLVERTKQLESQLEIRDKYEDIVGSSSAMRTVYDMIESVSYSDANVLIQGESGTGKELVAKAIHYRSPRAGNPFIVINCSALTETLLESELFGHVKGAFTGATATKRGLFEAAHTGTIFLDEIGDITPMMQVKLLRVLQEGEVKRVGSSEVLRVDVRTIAATNRDLKKAMDEALFREDLFYRLNVINIGLPPLRERVEDIPLLAHHFLRKYSERLNKNITGFAEDVMETFQSYRWIGNVRELENVLERSVVLARGDMITADLLPGNLTATDFARNASVSTYSDLEFQKAKRLAVNLFERKYVQTVLARCDGNVSEASRHAGMDRSNFRRIIKKHDIQL